MVGISSHVESSRMEQLTRGRRSGLGGLLHANRYLLISSATAVIGSFLYGTDQGVLSNLLTGENFGAKFPDVYTDAVLKGWVVAVLQLGAWLGALINGPLANKISRKYSITVAAFVSLFSPASKSIIHANLLLPAVHARKCTLRRCTKHLISLRGENHRRYRRRTGLSCRAFVSCRDCAVRVPRSIGLVSTAGHHRWHHGVILAVLRDQLYRWPSLQRFARCSVRQHRLRSIHGCSCRRLHRPKGPGLAITLVPAMRPCRHPSDRIAVSSF